MKPCFGYIRVSTQKQGEGVSLEAQKDAITAFASRNDLTITKWFEEKETAAKRGRPVFTDMLKQLKRGKASGLVMHKIDRSARNPRDWADIGDLSDAGTDIHFATESLDFRSRGGRLTADIQAVIAADYIRNLRDETIKGLRGRLKQGLYPFRAPIGYRDNGRGQPKTPCPEKAPLIQQAFELYATNQYSILSLRDELTRRGLTNHTGKPLSKHGIETILRNAFYTGLIEINRTGEIFDGIHEPLISMQTFKRVQDIKAGKAGKKLTRHNHLYRGLFRCGACGRSMIPERQKSFVYYRCQTKDCPKNTIREDRLDVAIHAAYLRARLEEGDAHALRLDWLAWLKSEERKGMLQSLDLRIAKAEERLGRLTDLLLDGAIDQESHRERMASLTRELAELRDARAEAAKADLREGHMARFLELMTNLAELHELLEPNEKRYLLENCFSNRSVSANEPCLEPYSWLTSRDFAELTPMVTHLGPLLELLRSRDISQRAKATKPKVPLWKYNLKNQRPDDLSEAA